MSIKEKLKRKPTANQTIREDVNSAIVGMSRATAGALSRTAARIVRLERAAVALGVVALVEACAIVWLAVR